MELAKRTGEYIKNIKIANNVPLDTYLVHLGEFVSKQENNIPVEIMVITGHDFRILVGFNPTNPDMLVTDGEIVKVPSESTNSIYNFEVKDAKVYIAWKSGKNALEEYKNEYRIQTPLKAPNFRKLTTHLDLKNIRFKCEY